MKLHYLPSLCGGALALAASAAVITALLPVASYAEDSDTAQVSVTVVPYMWVEYTGGDVTFELDYHDFDCGGIESPDHGDVNWGTNIQPWAIRVTRSEWSRDHDGCGHDDDWVDRDIHLQVNHGNQAPTDWEDVDLTQVEPPWLTGTATGAGTRTHVDWRVIDIGWGDHDKHNHRGHHYGAPPEGNYSCTVTFTIEYTGAD